jgi:hypothetical protein
MQRVLLTVTEVGTTTDRNLMIGNSRARAQILLQRLLRFLRRLVAIGFRVARREAPHNLTATMPITTQSAMQPTVTSTIMEILGM